MCSMTEWKTGWWLDFFLFLHCFIISWKQYISRICLIILEVNRHQSLKSWLGVSLHRWRERDLQSIKCPGGGGASRSSISRGRVQFQHGLYFSIIQYCQWLPFLECVYSPLLLEGLEASPVHPVQCLCQVDPLKTRREGKNKSVTQLIRPTEWFHPCFVKEGKACISSLTPHPLKPFTFKKHD